MSGVNDATGYGGAGAVGYVTVTPIASVSYQQALLSYQAGGWTQSGVQSYTGNNVMTQSTMTVQGNAFSVGGSSFTVGGGSVTVAYGLTTQNLTASTATFSGPVTNSSATFMGLSLSTQTTGSAGASVTALCRLPGTFATGGGCICTSLVGATGITGQFNCVTAGCVPNGYTCQDTGSTGAQCAAQVMCSRAQ